MADKEEKIKLGFDTSSLEKGESQIIAAFNKLNTGFKAMSVEAFQLSKNNQLITASFKGLTDQGKAAEFQMKKTTEELLRYNKAGQLIYASGPTKGRFAKANDVFTLSGFTNTDTSGANQNKMYEQALRLDAVFMQKQQLMRDMAIRMDAAYDRQKQVQFGQQLATTEQAHILALREDANYNRRKEEQLAQRYMLEQRARNAAQVQDTHINRKNYLMDWSAAIQEDKLRSGPTFFDKLFNQSAAIATGIVVSQVFMRMTSELANSVQEATKLEVKFSEIRTITEKGQKSLEEWGRTVRGLSDRFGTTNEDNAEGIYKAISSGVANGDNVGSFMSDANKFSSATVSTTTQAVNLLSSAMNSYHMNTEDANRVAAEFFKLIEHGKVRVEQIAENMGPLLAVASKLCIPLRDVNSAIAAMNNAGVEPEKAMMFLRNVMTQMLKESPEHKKMFSDWGVASGEAAFQTFGLVGVLEKLNAQVEHGGLQELASNFKDIRSLTGLSLLTGTGLDQFKANVASADNAPETYADKVRIAFESSGKKLQIEYQKIRNFFVYDFGMPVIDTFEKVATSMGGLSNWVVAGAKLMTAALVGLTVQGFINFTLAMGRTTLQLATMPGLMARLVVSIRVLWATLASNPWVLLATVIATAVTALWLFHQSSEDVAKASADKAKEMLEAWNMASQLKLAQNEDDSKKAMDTQWQIVMQGLARIRAGYSDLANKVIGTFDNINDKLKDSIEDFKNAFNDKLKSIEGRIKSLESMIKSVKNELLSFTEKRDLINFEEQIEGYTKVKKAVAELDYARQIALKGRVQEAKFTELLNKNDIEGAQEAAKQAAAYFDEALRLTDSAHKNSKLNDNHEDKDESKLEKALKKADESAARAAKEREEGLRILAKIAISDANADEHADNIFNKHMSYSQGSKKNPWIAMRNNLSKDLNNQARGDEVLDKEGRSDQLHNVDAYKHLENAKDDYLESARLRTQAYADDKKRRDEEAQYNAVETKAIKQQTDLVKERKDVMAQELAIMEKKVALEKKSADQLTNAKRQVFGELKDAMDVKFKDKDTPNDIAHKLQLLRTAEESFGRAMKIPGIASLSESVNIVSELHAKRDALEAVIKAKARENDIDKVQHEMSVLQKQDEDKLKAASVEKLKAAEEVNKMLTTLKANVGNMGTLMNPDLHPSLEPVLDTVDKIKQLLKTNEGDLSDYGNTRTLEAVMPLLKQYRDQTQNLPKEFDLDKFNGKGGPMDILQMRQDAYNSISKFDKSDSTLKELKGDIEKRESDVRTLQLLYKNAFDEMLIDVKQSHTEQIKSWDNMIEKAKNSLIELQNFKNQTQQLIDNEQATNIVNGLDNMNFAPGALPRNSTQTYAQNQTFGDININLNGGNNTQATVRELGLALKREIDRGTLAPLV